MNEANSRLVFDDDELTAGRLSSVITYVKQNPEGGAVGAILILRRGKYSIKVTLGKIPCLDSCTPKFHRLVPWKPWAAHPGF